MTALLVILRIPAKVKRLSSKRVTPSLALNKLPSSPARTAVSLPKNLPFYPSKDRSVGGKLVGRRLKLLLLPLALIYRPAPPSLHPWGVRRTLDQKIRK